MKRVHLFLLATLAAVPVVASAHTKLKGSTPADGSTVVASPASIMLMFSEATRLTELTLQRSDQTEEQKLGPLPESPQIDVSVPAPKLTSGAYTMSWRALGKDNHVSSGTIKFTVSANSKTASGRSTARDATGKGDKGTAPREHQHSH